MDRFYGYSVTIGNSYDTVGRPGFTHHRDDEKEAEEKKEGVTFRTPMGYCANDFSASVNLKRILSDL